MANEQMGLREFGRMLGKSGEAVRKAIATGKIPADCLGKKALSSGREVPVIINPEKARQAWGQNTDPTWVRDQEKLSAGRARAHAQAKGREPAPEPEPRDDEGGVGLTAGKGIPTIAQSNAITAAYKARITKLEYEEKAGKMVNAEQIKLRMFGMIKTAQTKLRGVPTKAKGSIPTLTVRDIEILENLIDDALMELAQSGS